MLNSVPTDTPVLSNLCRSIDPHRVVTKRVVTSGVVYRKPLWLCWVKVYCPTASQWGVPDEAQDPDASWRGEENAIDEDLSSSASVLLAPGESSGYLVGVLSVPCKISGIASNVYSVVDNTAKVWAQVWYSNAWVFIGSKIHSNNEWEEILFSYALLSNKIAIKVQSLIEGSYNYFRVNEFRFIVRLKTYLELKNGFSSNAGILFELDPAGSLSEHIVFTKPIRFSKGLFASFGPSGSSAEFGYVPDY